MGPARILVVEDDPTTSDLVATYLRRDGHRVWCEYDGRRALSRIQEEEYDLLLLDVMVPHVDGLALCEAARALGDTPVIFVTARTASRDRIEGLDLGADDYVSKPFDPGELCARIRAVLRRAPRGESDRIRRGPLTVDRAARRVLLDDVELRLTPTEFEILSVLASSDRAYSRARLLDCFPGERRYSTERTVDVHIHNLRAKIDPDPPGDTLIRTVPSVGYRLELP